MGRLFRKWIDGLQSRRTGLAVAIATVVLVLAVIVLVTAGLGRQTDSEHMKIAAEAIERAARQCYALEGAYPPTLEYLEENYGLMLDRDRFHYLYEVIGSNIHPIIEVLDK